MSFLFTIIFSSQLLLAQVNSSQERFCKDKVSILAKKQISALTNNVYKLSNEVEGLSKKCADKNTKYNECTASNSGTNFSVFLKLKLQEKIKEKCQRQEDEMSIACDNMKQKGKERDLELAKIAGIQEFSELIVQTPRPAINLNQGKSKVYNVQ